MCTIAQPSHNNATNSWWDGKLGIWSMGVWKPVEQASQNHPREKLVWKNKSISCVVYDELLKDKLISAIITKWPPGDRAVRCIKIQQGGSTVHIENNDPVFL